MSGRAPVSLLASSMAAATARSTGTGSFTRGAGSPVASAIRSKSPFTVTFSPERR